MAKTAKKKLNIVHITSEVEPFSKSGGLASVTGALPRAHAELGHNVIVITPFYDPLINKEKNGIKEVGPEHEIETIYGNKEPVFYLKGKINKKVNVYFIGNNEYFGGKKRLYGDEYENKRFLFFNIAALEFLKEIGFQPDIIHCHDWHTGLIPYFLKRKFKSDLFYIETASVFTIHNLAFQLGHDWWEIKNGDRDDGRSLLPKWHEKRKIERINFAKRAILNADVINTVSETYRNEILTKDFGEDLHRILKNREDKVFGIVNGIDYTEYNPLEDPGLYQRYSYKSPERKRANKEWLQKNFKLKVDSETPLLCMTSRITEQKGFALVKKIIKTLLRMNVQLIIMGDGDKEILKDFRKLEKKSGSKLTVTPFDSKYETSLYAGSDMLIMPSRFEPCGINQMIGLRYGCIPIAHHIGGLADTVQNFSPVTGKGNGFTFSHYDSHDLLSAITRAVETYKYKDIWTEIVERSMQEANSWKLPAEKYIALYKKALRVKNT